MFLRSIEKEKKETCAQLRTQFIEVIKKRNENPADFDHNLSYLIDSGQLIEQFFSLYKRDIQKLENDNDLEDSEDFEDAMGKLQSNLLTNFMKTFKNSVIDELFVAGFEKEKRIKKVDANFVCESISDDSTYKRTQTITFSDDEILTIPSVKNETSIEANKIHQTAREAFNKKMEALALENDSKLKNKI